MDMSQYLEMFIEESKEHLQSLNDQLLELENNPNKMEVIHEIFRAAHTLKGMSGTMGFTKMQKLTHDMENVLSAIRNEEMKANSNLLDILFKCLDALETYIDSIINTGQEGQEEFQDIIDALNLALQSGGDANIQVSEKSEVQLTEVLQSSNNTVSFNEYEKNVVQKALDEELNVYHIIIRLDQKCMLKAARAFIIFRTLEEYSDIVKTNPSVQEIEEEKFEFEFDVVVVTKEETAAIQRDILNVAEVAEVEIHTIEEIDNVEKAQVIEQVQPEVSTPDSTSTSSQVSTNEVKGENKAKGSANKTVRVDIDRLDNLMNLVSELIIIKNRLEGIVEKSESNTETNQKFTEPIEYLERVTTYLHDAVTKVRMVPLERVFNRFPRMIRDLARNLGKEIQLNITGEETELDRTVIDEIGDPLIHILRNSADHGLETIEARKAVGKPVKGTVNLSAYQDGNNVVIEVSDDGRGMDTVKIKNKAIEKGVITEAMGANMTNEDIIELLFKPSFSTAEKITDVSGRGVGLDVVKTKIEALGGVIEVKSQLGVGTTFIIRLPLTLAIIQALMVNVGEEQYAIPLNSIDIIHQIEKKDIQYIQKKEVYMYRNKVIPIVRLDKVLDVPNVEDKDQFTIVIAKKGEKQAGLVVDSLIGQQEIVIKTLGKYLSGLKVIAGATILGDGDVALILDTNTLVS